MRSHSFRCPNPDCKAVLSIPEEMMGQRVRCAGCGQSFLVPPADIAMAELLRRVPTRTGPKAARDGA